jgi:defect-in-organelle-trafficking protein DotC
MSRTKFFLMVSATSATMLAGCANYPTARMAPAAPAPATIGESTDNLRIGPAPVASPDDVKIALYNPDDQDEEITEIRRRALLEAAQGYGSQMGYARRGWEIENLLEQRSLQLSQVFDFNRVVTEAPVKAGYVIPPIVSRSFDAFEGDADGREASVAEEYLTIVAPGEIRPIQPNWRDYLLFTATQPEEPARSLYPSTLAEKELFETSFEEGWLAGVDLADAEISSRLDRLRRDYEGMLQYRRLVSMGMMDRMVLQDADFGVTGGGDEMRIGSRTVKIVSDAEFDTNPRRWSVRTVSERDILIVESGEVPPISFIDDLSN